jgi:beta-lactamase class A
LSTDRAQAVLAWALFFAAIVYAARAFVLAILVRGLAESKDSAALMADIARRIYESTQ